jgi:hypothetical protein
LFAREYTRSAGVPKDDASSAWNTREEIPVAFPEFNTRLHIAQNVRRLTLVGVGKRLPAAATVTLKLYGLRLMSTYARRAGWAILGCL